MRNKHPVFSETVDREVTLWRYFDFPKFTSLLHNRALYFSRADLLGDPLEGSGTRAREVERERFLENPPEGRTRKDLESVFRHNADIFERERKCAYVSCWHMGDHESMAMWRGYGGGPYGVAVRSTFGTLDDAIPERLAVSDHEEPIFLGRVRYLDYTSELERIPNEYNLYAQFLCKSVAYRHETEVRAIFADLMAGMSGTARPGFLVPIDLSQVVQYVTISPLAPSWFEDVVAATCRQFGFEFPLWKSIAATAPIF